MDTKIIAIICLTILEIIALLKGIDGQALSLITTIIGGLAGYSIAEYRKKERKERRSLQTL